MTTSWLAHDDDRVWSLVWLGLRIESDDFEGDEIEDAIRVAHTFLPNLAVDELRESLTEIVAATDIAHHAEHDPTGACDRYLDARPLDRYATAAALVERKRAEAFTEAELAVSVNDARHVAVAS